MLNQFRSSIAYKLCGFICGVLSAISLFLYKLPSSDSFKGEGALLLLPTLLIFIAITIIDALIYIVLTIIAYVSTNISDDKIKTNILADLGYLYSTGFMIFIYYKLYLLIIE